MFRSPNRVNDYDWNLIKTIENKGIACLFVAVTVVKPARVQTMPPNSASELIRSDMVQTGTDQKNDLKSMFRKYHIWTL